ncbi:hypothetical protein [Streptomyces sp. NRRL S-237]|uniref:hypothetical protein n=1 Tax=Streptomyces sp. NRRL S-237 TaxID=1463895 RepID=UPI00131BF994|nr:hypothetical protein [Streptomyces sp. NRRL S-237]
MSETVADDWSPADNPYAIAVSEAQWWQRTAALAVRRIRADDDDSSAPFFDSRQIDARQLCIALRQLLMAEKLEQIALADLGIDPAAGQALNEARAVRGCAARHQAHARWPHPLRGLVPGKGHRPAAEADQGRRHAS